MRATRGRDMGPEQQEGQGSAHGGQPAGGAQVLSAGQSYHLGAASRGCFSTFLWPGFGKEYDLILEMIPPTDKV